MRWLFRGKLSENVGVMLETFPEQDVKKLPQEIVEKMLGEFLWNSGRAPGNVPEEIPKETVGGHPFEFSREIPKEVRIGKSHIDKNKKNLCRYFLHKFLK